MPSRNYDMDGFCDDCKTRYQCYDGLVCHWDYRAAFDKALRHDDWRIFVIAQWFVDDDFDGDLSATEVLMPGAKAAVQTVRLLNALGVRVEDPEDDT